MFKNWIAAALFSYSFLSGLSATAACPCTCQSQQAEFVTSSVQFTTGQSPAGVQYPLAVGWASSLEEALKIASAKQKPIAIYFATKAEYQSVGEPTEAIRSYASLNGNAVPSSVYQVPKIIARLRALGVSEVVKIVNAKENSEWVSKCGATEHCMAIVSPDGIALDCGCLVGGGADLFLSSAKAKIDAWKVNRLAGTLDVEH